jgi:outer membrane lipoprotein-sorting protein
MRKKWFWTALFGLAAVAATIVPAAAEDATELVRKAWDYMRGDASVGVTEMIIHRPDWERTMTIKAWTEGMENTVFLITAPPKDAGNGTLKKGREMWMYNPKVNRVIKVPPSMMSQAWMGSDFSNNDLAKSDSVLVDYDHTLEKTVEEDGRRVHVIKCTPKPQAPVVWGMVRLRLRDDHITLAEEFYDEDLALVKALTCEDVKMLGGKLFPTVWVMRLADREDHYTRLNYRELEFKDDLPDRLFTLSNLRNPRR